MAGVAAFGTMFKKGGVAVAKMSSVSGPALSLDTDDVTAHDSTGGWEEVVATIIRSGEIKIEVNYDPSDVTHYATANTGLLHALSNRTKVMDFTLVFPGPVTWTFTGGAYVVGFEPAMPHEGKISGTFTIKPTGVVTLA